MIELYEHNRIAYDSAVSMLAETGKAAVVHPTGTGKSFIGFKLCEDNPDKKILWLSPSEYIFKTQLENLKAAGGDEPKNIRFLTYAKLMNMSEDEIAEIRPALCVCDEYHRAGAAQWQLGVQRFLKLFPDVPILGLTATAIRYLDNQRDMSEELFDGNVASEITLGEAIVRGILNPPKCVLSVFSYQKDLEKYERRVRTAKNRATRDAAEKYLEALRRALDKADGLDVIFDKHMTDRTGKYIVFCANKEHMDEMIEKTGEWFARVDKHPHVYSVYADDPGASKSFADFKSDEDSTHLRLLYCIDALNEGIHVENVSGVILLRPTVSPIIYKQQIGRALSASKKTDAVIFDIVMNIENLYSIGTIEEEMRVAMTYYRSFGDGQVIVNDQFKVIDELRDCRELFEKLNDTLTASWDTMYGYAKAYFEQHGNLEIPKRYKTPDGYSLGNWLYTQRKVRSGEQYGILGAERIARLDAIGMEWDGSADRTWRRNFAALTQYRADHGHIRVPIDFTTPDGIPLGMWVANLRTYRKSGIRGRYLTPDHVAELDALGMVWDVPDYLWEQNFAAAMRYHREHGNLNVPVAYVDPDGIRLGAWIGNLRQSRKGKGTTKLTDDQIAQLDALGMIWENRYTQKWEAGYAEAKKYYEKNGNLKVPSTYKTPSGYELGKWLRNQSEKYASGKLPADRFERLGAIGMVWEKVDPWEYRFSLARAYFEEHGNLRVPSRYNVEGVDLQKWLNNQKQTYLGKRKNTLTEEQIRRLESIGMKWKNTYEVVWDQHYNAAKEYFEDRRAGRTVEKNASIDRWIVAQRKYYREGKLTAEQIEKLNAIGIVWEPDAWEAGFAHAKSYFAEHGDLYVPAEYVCDDGYNLGIWISNQRTNHNRPTKYGFLTAEQTERLESLGMAWKKHDSNWNAAYAQAADYFRLHGDLRVSRSYRSENGFQLGSWVYSQREKYRKGTLSEEYKRKLDEIGMDWNDSSARILKTDQSAKRQSLAV